MVEEKQVGGENASKIHSERVAHLQTTVATLLRFASETTGLSVPADLVKQVTPLLRLDPEATTEAQEIALWTSCDALTQIIKPSTLESAVTAIQLTDWSRTDKTSRKTILPAATAVRNRSRRWIILTGVVLLFFIIVQGYAIGLGTAIEDVKSLTKALDAAMVEMLLLKTDADKSKDGDFASASLEAAERKEMNLSIRIDAARKALYSLLKPIEIIVRPLVQGFGNGSKQEIKTGKRSFKRVLGDVSAAARLDVDVYARMIYESAVGYLIPLLLGLLGAGAYVTRQISGAIQDNTYQEGKSIRDLVRLVQGATFGTLAGVLTSALQMEPSASNISIQAVALVCGYNSDMVFRAMDAAGIRFKEYLVQKS